MGSSYSWLWMDLIFLTPPPLLEKLAMPGAESANSLGWQVRVFTSRPQHTFLVSPCTTPSQTPLSSLTGLGGHEQAHFSLLTPCCNHSFNLHVLSSFCLFLTHTLFKAHLKFYLSFPWIPIIFLSVPLFWYLKIYCFVTASKRHRRQGKSWRQIKHPKTGRKYPYPLWFPFGIRKKKFHKEDGLRWDLKDR